MILVPSEYDSNITNVGISTCIYSDHSFVYLTIKTDDIDRGPGSWIMNKTVIQSNDFKNLFNTFWNYWKNEIESFDDHSSKTSK